MVLDLPERAIGRRMRGGEHAHPAEGGDLRERCVPVVGAALEHEIARRRNDQRAVRRRCVAPLVPEAPQARLDLRPAAWVQGRRALLGVEAPAIARHAVAGVETKRAGGRRLEQAAARNRNGRTRRRAGASARIRLVCRGASSVPERVSRSPRECHPPGGLANGNCRHHSVLGVVDNTGAATLRSGRNVMGCGSR